MKQQPILNPEEGSGGGYAHPAGCTCGEKHPDPAETHRVERGHTVARRGDEWACEVCNPEGYDRLWSDQVERIDRSASHTFANGVSCYDPNPIVWVSSEDCLHDEPRMVEKCGCGTDNAVPFDRDGDGIGEECRRCGEYISYTAKEV